MSKCMRTTIRLDDDLLSEAKVYAARRGLTLTRLIDDSLRETLARRHEAARETGRVEVPTSGQGGIQPGVGLNDSRMLWDLLDEPE